MPVKIKMPCLFGNATWKDIGYGNVDSIGNTKELQIWVALVQNKYEKDGTLEFLDLCEYMW